MVKIIEVKCICQNTQKIYKASKMKIFCEMCGKELAKPKGGNCQIRGASETNEKQ